jgi:peptidoglycan/xylan/chitin deacetylase (PgdA/CDA1 family)
VVVLMHDANPKTETVQALPAIIEGLQSAGYQIVPITENTKPVQHVKAVYMQ